MLQLTQNAVESQGYTVVGAASDYSLLQIPSVQAAAQQVQQAARVDVALLVSYGVPLRYWVVAPVFDANGELYSVVKSDEVFM